MAMRLFVVLALVALTGCQANDLRSEELKPHLDMGKDAFWDSFVKATKIAQDTLKTIKESELGQRVITKIEHSVKVAMEFETRVYEHFSVAGRDSYKMVSEQVNRLSERLQLKPYAEQLRANIALHVEKLRQVVAPYTESLDTKALKDTFRQKIRELRKTLEWRVEELQSQLGPSNEELQEALQQRLQEIHESVAPFTGNLVIGMYMRLYIFYEVLSPYVVDFREKLHPYTKDLESQLTFLW